MGHARRQTLRLIVITRSNTFTCELKDPFSPTQRVKEPEADLIHTRTNCLTRTQELVTAERSSYNGACTEANSTVDSYHQIKHFHMRAQRSFFANTTCKRARSRLNTCSDQLFDSISSIALY